MILYPLADYDTWIDQPTAATLAANYLNGAAFIALTVPEQEQYLMQAFRVINDLDGFIAPDDTLPDPLGCLPEAQLQVALQDLQFLLTLGPSSGNQEIKYQKAGPVEQGFYESGITPKSGSTIPATANTCLESFGADIASGSGMSLRKVR